LAATGELKKAKEKIPAIPGGFCLARLGGKGDGFAVFMTIAELNSLTML